MEMAVAAIPQSLATSGQQNRDLPPRGSGRDPGVEEELLLASYPFPRAVGGHAQGGQQERPK